MDAKTDIWPTHALSPLSSLSLPYLCLSLPLSALSLSLSLSFFGADFTFLLDFRHSFPVHMLIYPCIIFFFFFQSQIFTPVQCDQMARLVFQNLAICNNHNLPDSIKCAKIGSTFLQLLSRPSKNWPKTCKILQLWQNFANFGHTALTVEPERPQQPQKLNSWTSIELRFRLKMLKKSEQLGRPDSLVVLLH